MRGELDNLYRGDKLVCSSCGATVWDVAVGATTFLKSDVTRAYYRHLHNCFAMKRRVIEIRKSSEKRKFDTTMKTRLSQQLIALILFVFMFIGCAKDDPGPQMGCLTGLTGNGTRVTIRCCTKEQFQAGSNVNAGGTSNWSTYTSHEWKAVSDCSQCQ